MLNKWNAKWGMGMGLIIVGLSIYTLYTDMLAVQVSPSIWPGILQPWVSRSITQMDASYNWDFQYIGSVFGLQYWCWMVAPSITLRNHPVGNCQVKLDTKEGHHNPPNQSHLTTAHWFPSKISHLMAMPMQLVWFKMPILGGPAQLFAAGLHPCIKLSRLKPAKGGLTQHYGLT